MVTNAGQQVIERHDYLPFGEEWAPPASISPVKFAGKERDALLETQRDYFLARYTRPTSGRFMSPDHWSFVNPLNPQTWNLYVYALNNPLRFIDPSGHCALDYGDLGEEDDMAQPQWRCDESITVTGTAGVAQYVQTGPSLGSQDFGPRSGGESADDVQSGGSGGTGESSGIGSFLVRTFGENGCGRLAALTFAESLLPFPSGFPDGQVGIDDIVEHAPAAVVAVSATATDISKVYP
ncbi:MAG: RHS repeat-associated core domain-containing protein, partial [Vicinamibacterales bacterium]